MRLFPCRSKWFYLARSHIQCGSTVDWYLSRRNANPTRIQLIFDMKFTTFNLNNKTNFMMDRYQNKYRISSARLKNWDYSQAGAYFVTICTKNHRHWFGQVKDDEMNPTRLGKIVANEWQRTEIIRTNVEMDQWIVMPNHFHGIVVIYDEDIGRDPPKCVSNESEDIEKRVPSQSDSTGNRFGPQKENLAAIIRGFKSSVTRKCRALGFADFAWQTRYYDHIIRDDDSLNSIREYILYNPQRWCFDRENRNRISRFKKQKYWWDEYGKALMDLPL